MKGICENHRLTPRLLEVPHVPFRLARPLKYSLHNPPAIRALRRKALFEICLEGDNEKTVDSQKGNASQESYSFLYAIIYV